MQLKDQLKRAIAGGALRTGDQLPTVRDLAGQAVVNPNTVARVYRELELEGLVTTQRGVGTFVAERRTAADQGAERARLLDAAADRYLAETAQLGLSRSEAARFLNDKVAGDRPVDG
jgi:GntR family transcriptional regulator